jgi:hypothetical protein
VPTPWVKEKTANALPVQVLQLCQPAIVCIAEIVWALLGVFPGVAVGAGDGLGVGVMLFATMVCPPHPVSVIANIASTNTTADKEISFLCFFILGELFLKWRSKVEVLGKCTQNPE